MNPPKATWKSKTFWAGVLVVALALAKVLPTDDRGDAFHGINDNCKRVE
jgi:hypothetical protein